MGRHHQDTLHAWSAFQDINSSVKNFAIQSQINYEISICSQLGSNTKLFHSYIKHREVSRPLVGTLKLSDGSLTANPDVMAEGFVSSFYSVFSSAEPPNPFVHQTCSSNIGMLNISVNEVESLLNELESNSGMGGGGVHPRFLKVHRSDLSVPLSVIFNSSLQSGSLLTQWLSSFVILIFNKSSRYDSRNYCPINLTSMTCKVLERAIARHLTSYLKTLPQLML